MDYFNEIKFEQEKQRLLTTYKCETLDEVIAYLKMKIKIQQKELYRHSPSKGE